MFSIALYRNDNNYLYLYYAVLLLFRAQYLAKLIYSLWLRLIITLLLKN